MNLYPWQEECLQKWKRNQYRGIVQAVTGAGKTFLALAAIQTLQEQVNTNLKVKIVVPTSSLMHQWNKALREFSGNAHATSQQIISLRGGGYKDDPDCPYTIYVINSARYELARRILADMENGNAVLLIADECHHYENGQNSLIFEFLPYLKDYPGRYFSLGLSATLPYGLSKSILSEALGKKIYHYDLSQAKKQNRISPYDIYHVSLSLEPTERAEYQELSDRLTLLYRRLLGMAPQLQQLNRKDQFELLRSLVGSPNKALANAAASYIKLTYKRRSMVCLASVRVECAFQLISLLPPQERILVFGERIPQADELYQRLSALYPGRVGRYHSQMNRQVNKNTLQRFRDGEIRILITCKSLDEGLDVPDASVGIILSGTGVQRQRIQRLGRILRKNEEKKRASLYYLHVADTAEDTCFLPDDTECHITELEFFSDDGHFENPPYDRRATLLLERLQKNVSTPEILKEYRRCINLGRIRQDWLDTEENINRKICEAKNVTGRNYWICMKHMR